MKILPSQPARTDTGHVHRFILKPEDTLLTAIDLQEQPLSTLEGVCREAFLMNCRLVLRASMALHIPVVVSEHLPERFGPTTRELDDLVGDAPRITKFSGSCWGEGRIRAVIKATERKTVLVIGMEAHLCVLRTVVDLLQTGYNPVVVADAVCSRSSFHTETALNALAHAGAVVYPAETVACMLLDRTDSALFEEILCPSRGDMPPLPRTKEAANR